MQRDMPDLPAHLTKYYESVVQEGPCASNEVICLLTTDRVDRDKEVVVPSGGVFTNYNANRIVMYGHASGKPSEGEVGMPVAKNLWIKATRDGRGLVGKHAYDLDDPFSFRVCGKAKRGFLNTHSITFLPIEFGPPTKEEIAKHPHWAEAKTIYRKWELIEYSVVAMPANVDAVTLAKRSKPMEETPEAVADETPAETTEEPTTALEPQPEPVSKAHAEPDGDEGGPDVDDDGDGEESLPLRQGHFAKCVGGSHKGMCGKIASVHRGEMVPDVDDDVRGTKAEPAARLCCYKRMGEGHVPTEHHVGVLMSHLERIEDLKAPKKRQAKAAPVGPKRWTEAERQAYLMAKTANAGFDGLLAHAIQDVIETRILGKV